MAVPPKIVNCGYDPVPPGGPGGGRLPEYLDSKEAAGFLKKSLRTLRRLVKLGIIVPRRITKNGHPVFKRSDLVRKLEASQRGEGMMPKKDDPSMG